MNFDRRRQTGCDRRQTACPLQRCHAHDLEEGILELRECIRQLHEGLRDLHCNRLREADREFQVATCEAESSLDHILDGLREIY